MLRLRIREVAEAQGLDAAKLARRSDLNYMTVLNLWKNPYRDIAMSTLEKLATALGVDVAELIEQTDGQHARLRRPKDVIPHETDGVR